MGMFSFSPAGFIDETNPEGNEILTQDMMKNKTGNPGHIFSPHQLYLERMMTWLNEEFKSHAWDELLGEFEGLADANGFIFNFHGPTGNDILFVPDVDNSNDFLPLQTFENGFKYKNFTSFRGYHKGIYADKQLMQDLNDIFYNVARRIDDKFDGIHNRDESIQLSPGEFFSNSTFHDTAIDDLDKHGKLYKDQSVGFDELYPKKENRTASWGRFFPNRSPLGKFSGFTLGSSVEYKTIGLGDYFLKGVKSQYTYASMTNDELFLSSTGGVLGSKKKGGLFPILNVSPHTNDYSSRDMDSDYVDFYGGSNYSFSNGTETTIYESFLKNYEEYFVSNFGNGFPQGFVSPDYNNWGAISISFGASIDYFDSLSPALWTIDGSQGGYFLYPVIGAGTMGSSTSDISSAYYKYIGNGTLKNSFGLISSDNKISFGMQSMKKYKDEDGGVYYGFSTTDKFLFYDLSSINVKMNLVKNGDSLDLSSLESGKDIANVTPTKTVNIDFDTVNLNKGDDSNLLLGGLGDNDLKDRDTVGVKKYKQILERFTLDAESDITLEELKDKVRISTKDVISLVTVRGFELISNPPLTPSSILNKISASEFNTQGKGTFVIDNIYTTGEEVFNGKNNEAYLIFIGESFYAGIEVYYIDDSFLGSTAGWFAYRDCVPSDLETDTRNNITTGLGLFTVARDDFNWSQELNSSSVYSSFVSDWLSNNLIPLIPSNYSSLGNTGNGGGYRDPQDPIYTMFGGTRDLSSIFGTVSAPTLPYQTSFFNSTCVSWALDERFQGGPSVNKTWREGYACDDSFQYDGQENNYLIDGDGVGDGFYAGFGFVGLDKPPCGDENNNHKPNNGF